VTVPRDADATGLEQKRLELEAELMRISREVGSAAFIPGDSQTRAATDTLP